MEPDPLPPTTSTTNTTTDGDEEEEEDEEGEGTRIGSPHQISSDPEPDADDWDDVRTGTPSVEVEGEGKGGGRVAGGSDGFGGGNGRREGGGGGGDQEVGTGDGVSGEALTLEEVDWDAINDEVEAAMNESDDEEGDGRSEVTEDDGSSMDDANSIIRCVFPYRIPPFPLSHSTHHASLTVGELGKQRHVDTKTKTETPAQRDAVRAGTDERDRRRAGRPPLAARQAQEDRAGPIGVVQA